MNYRIAIIGPENVTSGFKALGVLSFPATNGEDALNTIKEIRRKNQGKEDRVAVIIIMENIAKQIPPQEFEKMLKEALPAVISLPGIEGSSGEGVAKLKKLAERAIGSDVLG